MTQPWLSRFMLACLAATLVLVGPVAYAQDASKPIRIGIIASLTGAALALAAPRFSLSEACVSSAAPVRGLTQSAGRAPKPWNRPPGVQTRARSNMCLAL